MIPIARQYPGAREFVESYRKEFPGADLSFQSAAGYGGCQILVEAIRRAGSLNGEKLRDAILKMNHNTVYGAFRVDRDGVQVAHKMLLVQWQDGKKVIVWPEELAANQPRFPTPPWSQRPSATPGRSLPSRSLRRWRGRSRRSRRRSAASARFDMLT